MRQRIPLLPIEATALTESIQKHLDGAYTNTLALRDMLDQADPLVPLLEHLCLRLCVAEVRVSLVRSHVKSRP